MPYASKLYIVLAPESLSEKRGCRKCGRTDVELPQAHHRDYICVECNREVVREWQQSHPEQRRAQSRKQNAKSRASHPEWALWYSAKARAKKVGVPFSIQVEDILIPPCCPILGLPLQRKAGRGGGDASPSLDRIVPEKGYVVGNIAVISNRANRIKSNASAEEIERVAAWLRATLSGGMQ